MHAPDATEQQEWETILATAWWLLVQNSDLLTFCMCYFAEVLEVRGGWESFADCVVSRVQGTDLGTRVTLVDFPDATQTGSFFWVYTEFIPLNWIGFSSHADVGMTHDLLQKYRDAASDGERICVAAATCCSDQLLGAPSRWGVGGDGSNKIQGTLLNRIDPCQ